MSEEKKLCSKENLCEECQVRLKEALAKHEDWEVNCKKYIEENQMYTHHYGNSLIQYSITGGYSYYSCPHGWGKSVIKKNDFGDQIELEHECHVKIDNQIQSGSTNTQDLGSNSQKNYLPWFLGGIGLVSLIGVLVYFSTRKRNKEE